MRSFLIACVALAMVGDSARAQPTEPFDVEQQRQFVQKNIDEILDKLAAALRMDRSTRRENFPAARAHLETLGNILRTAHELVRPRLSVPDRIQPFIDDAERRRDQAQRVMALCIRHTQQNDRVERFRLTLQINRILTDEIGTGAVTDNEDRMEIRQLEGFMRRQVEEETRRLEELNRLHGEFRRIVASIGRLGIPIDGPYEGTFQIDPKKTMLVYETNGVLRELHAQEAQQVGFFSFTVRGTEVNGEAAYGEGEGRAVFRITGRYNPADERLEATADGGTLPPGLPEGILKNLDLKIKGKPTLVWPGMKDNQPRVPGTESIELDGTWRLRMEVNLDFPQQESENAPVEIVRFIELVGEGTWNAGRTGDAESGR